LSLVFGFRRAEPYHFPAAAATAVVAMAVAEGWAATAAVAKVVVKSFAR
jgi:hypothetical protein